MNTTRFLAIAVLLIASGTIVAAQAQEHPQKHDDQAKMENDVLSVARDAGNYETFLAAVQAAGLTKKLQSKGPFTVFAPTDEAFAELPAGTVDDLLEPANKARLAGLLANHVVPGTILQADMKTMKATNVSGQDLAIRVVEGVATVNGARIVEPDLVASNGIIHGIRSVILSTEPVERQADDKPKDHPAH